MIKVLGLKDATLWSCFVNGLPAARRDVYFTPDYYSLYEAYGDGQAICFVFEKDGDLAVYPFLKNSLSSLIIG